MVAIDLDEFNRLKSKAENLKVQAERAQGALEQNMKQLQEEFECESVEEARVLLEELAEEKEKIEASYEKALDTFKVTWGDKL